MLENMKLIILNPTTVKYYGIRLTAVTVKAPSALTMLLSS